MRNKFAVVFLCVLVACSGDNPEQAVEADISKPNILLIIADDLGYAELGSFGGEIPTPNLDKLALAGVRFSQLRVAPTCSPSRAMLFTGVDNHKAGLGNMMEELAPNQKGQPGHEGYLNHNVVTVATLLKDAGYRTYYSGKWHLGLTKETGPKARGFEHSFAMLAGGAHHHANMKPAYAPDPNAVAPYRDNHDKLSELPVDYRYSSQFFVDKLIEYFEADAEPKKQQPFFAVLSFMAPHWPLQAPQAVVDKYKGHYDQGHEQIAAARLDKQKEIGLIPTSAQLAPMLAKGKHWDELSQSQQRTEARAMEIYAAMVDQLDVHSGRLLQYLEDQGLMDNTLIIFLSENGAEGHDLDQTWPAELFPEIRAVIDNRHDFSFENMGKPNSYVLYGPNWGWAASPAFRSHKGSVHEGGLRVPVFMYYPKKLASGTINHAPFHIKDIVPTILSITGVEHPGEQYQGRSIEPISGMDMLPYISKTATKNPPSTVEIHEIFGKRYVLKYPWKLVHQPPPQGTDMWQLYDLEADLAEINDLADEHPDIVAELSSHWRQYVVENNVILPDWVTGY